jgi:rRNA maturation RNase YbeY
VSRGRELARLVVHGGLHLAGLDHQRPAERSRMRSREDRVLAAAAGVVRALEKLLAGGS